MKIALIGTEALACPPKRYGGVESMVYDLCKGLTEKGIDVTLFACNGSKSPSGKLIEVIEEGWGRTGQCEEFEKRIVGMKHALKKFDVIHDNSHIKPCWKIHKRVLNTLHWEQNPGQCHRHNIVAISEGLANWVRPRNKGRKVRVVHNGCDFSKFAFKKDKSDRFLFLSAITPAKGADVALLVAKEMGLKIDFAGLGGSTSVAIEQESKINPNIRYLGEVSEEQKISLYQNAKALIFPTGVHGNWVESFGLVVIEAMSCGTPAIAWNNGAMPEIIEHNKTGFICNSLEDIKNAIRNIDKIRQEDCRKRVEENFTYQVMAKNYIKLYKKLIDGKSW